MNFTGRLYLISYFKKIAYLFVLIGYSWASAGSYDDFFSAIGQDDASKIVELLRRGFDPNTVDPAGNAGLLLTRVELLKHGEEKNFAVVDAAMNDLARPALYDAYHEIVKVDAGETASGNKVYEIVGPICESGDFLGHDRALPLAPGDLLAILSAGAYGMAMSSNYNTRPRAAEVMIDGDQMHLIRRRETVAELFAAEALLP